MYINFSIYMLIYMYIRIITRAYMSNCCAKPHPHVDVSNHTCLYVRPHICSHVKQHTCVHVKPHTCLCVRPNTCLYVKIHA